jgi:exopolyphosphatase/guanosine-5'-triphosphate,3'-diphosphate pyrophosphatase
VKCLHAHYAWYLVGGDDPVGRWVAEQLAAPGTASRTGLGTSSGNLAAIDCGTLSTRLLVSAPDSATLVRLTRITGLGQGVDGAGSLRPEAVERALAVLREYRRVMDDYGVSVVRMVGTSALRDAADRASFSDRAAALVGAPLELLGGEDEGLLSFAGATADLPPDGGPWFVADIGGGSTELAVGPHPVVARSLNLGCVRVTERFLVHDPPAPHEVAAARSWLSSQYVQAEIDVPELRSARDLVGLAGTVAALASYDQGLATYDRQAVHHYVLARGAVERALDQLASQPAAGRAGLPGIEAARAPSIVGGTLILATLMAHFGFEDCLVSESDILDGLVLTLVAHPPAAPSPPSLGAGAAG